KGGSPYSVPTSKSSPPCPGAVWTAPVPSSIETCSALSRTRCRSAPIWAWVSSWSGGLFCFFFQAEDGIRALYVTGVQTCALPISGSLGCLSPRRHLVFEERGTPGVAVAIGSQGFRLITRERGAYHLPELRARIEGIPRSEERRVGKEWKSGVAPSHRIKSE